MVTSGKANCNCDILVYCSYHSLIKDVLYSNEVHLYNSFVCVHIAASYPLDLFFSKYY